MPSSAGRFSDHALRDPHIVMDAIYPEQHIRGLFTAPPLTTALFSLLKIINKHTLVIESPPINNVSAEQ
jgi:hypothetical protein